MQNYPPEILDNLVCPQCNQPLVFGEDQNFSCPLCQVTYGYSFSGSLDLRLQKPKSVNLNITLSPLYDEFKPPVYKESDYASPAVDYSSIHLPRHVTPEILSWFPRARSEGALALDVGCCDAVHREICEHAGFTYAGIDIQAELAPLLADAHAIPFRDKSVDFAISFCVFESLQFQLLAIQEVYRVLKPGAIFIGSIAFLEPFHDQSYFHPTHYGIMQLMAFAGFETIRIFYGKDWTGLDANSRMGLFPRMPDIFHKAVLFPTKLLSRLYWAAAGLVFKNANEENMYVKNAGAFSFVARKPD